MGLLRMMRRMLRLGIRAQRDKWNVAALMVGHRGTLAAFGYEWAGRYRRENCISTEGWELLH